MGIAANSLVVRQPGANSAARDAGVAEALFLLALGIYGGSAAFLGRTASPKEAYFDHLADALLHGQTFLVNPPSTYDLTLYQGRWYVPFLPLPAILLMPWVAVSGVSQVNNVAFGAFVGAWLSVGLLLIPLLAYYNTGWWQFGYRFSLDLLTPLVLLLAIGAAPAALASAPLSLPNTNYLFYLTPQLLGPPPLPPPHHLPIIEAFRHTRHCRHTKTDRYRCTPQYVLVCT